jgi:hypothetical protein
MKDVHPLEPLVEQLAGDIARTVESLPEASRPFGARKLSQAEQLDRYAQQRDDPTAWSKLISEKGWGATLKYAKRMESQWNKQAPRGASEVMPDATATDTR